MKKCAKKFTNKDIENILLYQISHSIFDTYKLFNEMLNNPSLDDVSLIIINNENFSASYIDLTNLSLYAITHNPIIFELLLDKGFDINSSITHINDISDIIEYLFKNASRDCRDLLTYNPGKINHIVALEDIYILANKGIDLSEKNKTKLNKLCSDIKIHRDELNMLLKLTKKML